MYFSPFEEMSFPRPEQVKVEHLKEKSKEHPTWKESKGKEKLVKEELIEEPIKVKTKLEAESRPER